MSLSGRLAHECNKQRHNQGGSARPRISETIETATWMSDDMELCRHLYDTYTGWGVTQFLVHRPVGELISESEAERRLRYLSQLGFLRMSYNKEQLRFEWTLDNPNLPRASELKDHK